MSTPLRPTLLAVCGDAGGARAVAPVLARLGADGQVDARALAYRQARAVWAERGLKFEELPEPRSAALAERWLRETGAALLLSGTSVNGVEWEKQFIITARRLGIPALAVLDFWSNYAARFSEPDAPLACVPDRIAVMDARARRDMADTGFAAERLVVTGQPAWDDLAECRSRFTAAQREAMRQGLGITPGERLVLFASQPIAEFYGADPRQLAHPGYDEQQVLDALVVALGGLAAQYRQRIVLVVRPHPRQASAHGLLPADDALRVIETTVGDARQLAMSADLVTGMNSVLLVEACYLGCLTASLQPGLRQPDALPTNAAGLSRPAYALPEIRPVVEALLFDDDARRDLQARLAEHGPAGGATTRVVELLYELLASGATGRQGAGQ